MTTEGLCMTPMVPEWKLQMIKKKVAIYTRVSTEHEEQVSAMANQKDWYSAILNIHPEWDVVQMYADEGVTGTAAYKRKAFMEMIRDAYDGKFDMILTREVSRFARNTVDTLNYTRQLKRQLYQQVQERLEQRRRGWKDTVTESREISIGRKIGDIWTKKLQCECGNRYVRRRWHTRMDGSIEYGYHCYGQVHTGSVRTRSNKGLSVDGICTTPVIPDWRLQMMVCTIFRYCLQDVGGVLKLVEMMLMKHLDDKNSADGDAGRIDVLRREISGLQKKLDNCVELLIEGDLSKEEFRKKKEQYEHRIAELDISLQELVKKAEEERRSAENLDKRVRSLINGLKSKLDHIDDEMHEIPDGIIDAFVEKIVVRGDGFDWYLRGCGAEDDGYESANGNMLLREMTFTKEDAKEYLYAIDNRRRIHRWVDIKDRVLMV